MPVCSTSSTAALCLSPCGLSPISAFVQLFTDRLPPSKKPDHLLGKEKEIFLQRQPPAEGMTVTNLTGTFKCSFYAPPGFAFKDDLRGCQVKSIGSGPSPPSSWRSAQKEPALSSPEALPCKPLRSAASLQPSSEQSAPTEPMRSVCEGLHLQQQSAALRAPVVESRSRQLG